MSIAEQLIPVAALFLTVGGLLAGMVFAIVETYKTSKLD